MPQIRQLKAKSVSVQNVHDPINYMINDERRNGVFGVWV